MLPYFQRVINIDKMFGFQDRTLPNTENAKDWMEYLENMLSPENLSCDGELHGAALRAKEKELEEARLFVGKLIPGWKEPEVFSHFYPNKQMKAQRREKLQEAVSRGFVVGTQVILSNGIVGKIAKVNTTRVKVIGNDGRKWSVPPGCMVIKK